ncbi:lipopolysaccharide biosynthesis protein [Exiguobacterium mexicanum]|uniref:lipopolysaccharide biosynthesis protein n=1 Tax=Exiguobacterium mexicanum TaxID=340146 RepID=UPI00385077D4
MSEIKKLGKSTAIFFLGNVLSKIVLLFMLKIYTENIEPEEFGYFDVSTTLTTIISAVIYLDIWMGIMRYALNAKSKKQKHLIISNGLLVTIVSTIVYTSISYVVYLMFDFEYSGLLYLTGLLIAFQSFAGYIARVYEKNYIYVVSGLSNTFTNAIISFILIIYYDFGILGLYLSSILGMLVQILLIIYNLKKELFYSRIKFDIKIFKTLVFFSAPLSLNSISYWILHAYGKIAIVYMIGLNTAGQYAVVTKFGAVLTLVSTAFTLAWQELAFKKNEISDQNSKFYTNATNMYLKFLVFGFIILIPLLSLLADYLIAPEYELVYPMVPLFVLATLISILASYLGNILGAYEKTKSIFISTLVAALVNIIIIHSLISFLGIYAAILGFGIGYFVNVLMRLHSINLLITLNVEKRYLFKLFPWMVSSTFVFYMGNFFMILMYLLLITPVVIKNFKEELYIIFNIIKKVAVK